MSNPLIQHALSTFIFISSVFALDANAGVEIGNGWKIVENLKGGYSIVVPDKMEVGSTKTYTEIIAPLSQGTPRARMVVNIVNDSAIGSLTDLVESRRNENWIPTVVNGLSGIKKEETLPTKLRQIEIRLFLQAGHVVVISLEGVPSPVPVSPFEAIKESVGTFKLK